MTDNVRDAKLASAVIHSIETALAAAIEQLNPSSATARLDAEILLSHLLRKNRAFLRAWPETRLDTPQFHQYQKLIDRRKQSTPIAYLTESKEFWSNNYRVSPDVLIPRPETELLVEMALEIIPSHRPVSILELGTGTGIIGISLALERPKAAILATDISSAALDIARHNAKRHQITNIRFLSSNWFESIPSVKYDIVISNPPYVADEDPHLAQGDLVFEPGIALRSGPLGMDALTRIADCARKWLKPDCHLLLEHGYRQAPDLNTLLTRLGYRNTTTQTDLQGHPRATQSTWPGLF